MPSITLTLKNISAHFDGTEVVVPRGEKLTINLVDNGLTKGKVLLYFNGKAFVFKDKKVEIPEQQLKSVNTVLIQDKTANGTIFKEWRHNEKLVLDLERLDVDGEKRLLAEREGHRKMAEQYKAMSLAYQNLLAQHNKDYAEWQNEKQKLATEIIKLANKVSDLEMTVKAIKNEPLV